MRSISYTRKCAENVVTLALFALLSFSAHAVTNIACTNSKDADGINAAIQAEGPGGRVNLTGTCRENIVIAVDNFVLSRGGSRPTIIASNRAELPAIRVIGARNVQLRGLIVRSSSPNISIESGASAEVAGVLSFDSFQGPGLDVDEGSPVRIKNSIFRDNQGPGVQLNRSSAGTMDSVEVTGINIADPDDGSVVVSDASALEVIDSTITNNNGEGITVSNHSSARMRGNTISNNGTLPTFNSNTGGNTYFQYFSAGVGVYNHSYARFEGGNVVADNAYAAVAAYSNSNIRQGVNQPERDSNTGQRIGPRAPLDTFTMRALGVDPIFGGNEDQNDAVAVEAGRLSVVDLRNANITGGMNSFSSSFVEMRFGSVDATANRPIYITCSGGVNIQPPVSFDDDGAGGNNTGAFEAGAECDTLISE